MEKATEILLIHAHSRTHSSFFNKFVYTSFYPSITLEQLISITPKSYQVDYVDERYQSIDLNWKGSLVGISALTPNALHAYSIADEFRKKGMTVVLGGYHPSALPEEALKHADAVVIGEAEISWPQLLRDFENRELKPLYQSPLVDPKTIPSPRRLSGNYPYIGVIQASRGCPSQCRFCAINNVEGSRFRARPIEQVIKEIQSLETERFMFADSSMTIDTHFTKQLFQEMIGLNKKFSCYGNINVLQGDDELLSLAKKAGCETWLIGFESINQESLRHAGKSTNKVQDYSAGVKRISEHEMRIIGLFIFGFDADTPDVFETTLKAIYEWKLDRAAFAILTPFPGTELFKELEKEGRILTRDWAKYNLREVVFQPRNLSADQLFHGRNTIVKKYYSFSNCLRRSIQDKHLDFNQLIRRTAGDLFLNRYFKYIR
jgi:radical SAM superfamily enzyme YgiQ (UPF0313 family)